jgi:hypothetical protein
LSSQDFVVKWVTVAHPDGSTTRHPHSLKGREKLPSASGHASSSGTSKRRQGNQDVLSEAEGQDSTKEDDVFIEELAEMSERRHPGDVINEYLLKKVCANDFGSASRSVFWQCPNARVAVTHDDDWCAVIEDVRLSNHRGYEFAHSFMKADKLFPDDDELLFRVCRTYYPVYYDGMHCEIGVQYQILIHSQESSDWSLDK